MGLIWLGLVGWFVFMCRRAPCGFEDERGFHFLEPGPRRVALPLTPRRPVELSHAKRETA